MQDIFRDSPENFTRAKKEPNLRGFASFAA
jgi:hypothetical protein